jgi:hypothetical protein
MAKYEAGQHNLIAALLAIAAILLLLITAGIWAWRTPGPISPSQTSTASTAVQQQEQGPLASMAQWIEPPPRPVYASNLLFFDVSLTQLTVDQLDSRTVVWQMDLKQFLVQEPVGPVDFVLPPGLNDVVRSPAVDDGATTDESK